MAETKYGKYFISNTPPDPLHPQTRNKVSEFPWVNHPISTDEELGGTLPGLIWVEPNIVVRSNDGGPETGGKPHNHDFDEYMLFMSFDPDNTGDLGGEVEFWIEGEQHIFDKTTLIYIPKYLYHCPFYIRRVDKPFGFIPFALTQKYAHLSYSQDPKYADYYALDEIQLIKLGGKSVQVTQTFSEYLQWVQGKHRRNVP